MGNNSAKHHSSSSRDKPKKNVHWKSAEPPSAPGKPNLSPNFDRPTDVLTIKWDRSHTDGGSPIIGYLVEHRRIGLPNWIKATASLLPYPELSLTGLEPGWRYQFRVFAQNVVGLSESSLLSDPITVTLQRNATAPPQFLNELHDTTVLENDQCEFNVNVTGTPPPRINWFKDGFEIFSSRRTKIINDQEKSTLIIHQTALTDEGEIKCTATNRAGHVVTRLQLRIEAPPKIRLPRQYEDGFLVEAGEMIKLKVGIAGRPIPSIAWMHNGEIIKNVGRCEITTNDKNSFLKIIKATRNDRGEYNVRALNKLGEFNTSFLVTVTAKPNPPENVRITMSLGKSVTLTWSPPTDDGGCKIGNYIVEYFRIGWDVWLKASSTRQLTTTLNDLIEGSEYKFRVKAESPYGLSEPSVESRTLFVPDHKRGIISPTRELSNQNASAAFSPKSGQKLFDNEIPHKSVNQIIIPEIPKNVELISQIYDDEAIARELNYGTKVDTVYKKKEISINQRRKSNDNSKKQINNEPTKKIVSTKSKLNNNEDIVKSQSRRQIRKKIETNDSDYQTKNTKNDYVHTSNEFMLVLYENEQEPTNKSDEKNQFDLDLKEAIFAPPLSLSTPDLHDISAHEPLYPLRRSASSSELLYEKAMQRFYEAVQLDEAEMARKKSVNVEPNSLDKVNSSDCIRVNNKRVNDKNEFDLQFQNDKYSSKLQQTHRTTELFDDDESKQSDWEDDYNRDLRQEIIESQDKRRSLSREPLPSALYEDDYTDSTASSVSVSASASVESIEQFLNSVRSASSSTTNIRASSNDELETYHPQMEVRSFSPYRKPDPGQAAVILNRPIPLPDPDYIPKPILKRPPNENVTSDKPIVEPIPKPPPTKPEKRGFLQLFKKTPSNENIKKSKNNNSPNDKKALDEEKFKEKAQDKTKVDDEQQSSKEENKVVIDHYSDLVRELGGRAKPKVPLYLNSEALREVNARADWEEQEAAVKAEKEQTDIAMNAKQLKDDQDEEEAARVRELTNKLNQFQNVGVRERSRSNSVQRDLVEISVEQTNTISYSLREIKQPAFSSNDPSPNADTNHIMEPFKTITHPNYANRNELVMGTQSVLTSHTKTSESSIPLQRRTSDSSNQIEGWPESRMNRRSHSKSPMSQQRTSVSSTVLKVTRMPIQENYADIAIDLLPSVSPAPRCQTPEQLQIEAEINVKSSLSYTTDLAMFLFACWLYLFKDARLAVPILILMVYRQAKNAIEKKLQKWTKRKSI